jgi:hypothetical protein
LNGSANTGGGGGGGGWTPSTGQLAGSGGNGGSGVIILKYSNIFSITLGAGVVGSTSSSGSEKVTEITAGAGSISWSIS